MNGAVDTLIDTRFCIRCSAMTSWNLTTFASPTISEFIELVGAVWIGTEVILGRPNLDLCIWCLGPSRSQANDR